MEEILKQEKSKATKSLKNFFLKILSNRKFKEGEITTGIVEEIGKKFIFVRFGT